MQYVLQTEHLTKTYGKKTVVNDVSMNIEKGDIYGFIGENGAGKTSFMKMVLGITFPTSGSIKLFEDEDLLEERRKIGSLVETPALYPSLSAEENLKIYCVEFGIDDSEIHELLRLVDLDNTGKLPARKFSLGMKQRLGIAIAMLDNPEFMVLDEPVNGLDPKGIKDIRELVLKLNHEKKTTFLISSHLLDELGKIATRYGIISKGVLVEELTSEELEKRCSSSVTIKTTDNSKAVEALRNAYHDVEVEENGEEISFKSTEIETAELSKTMSENGAYVIEMRVTGKSPEEYFIERM
ncbi:MAG: ABC transporter ATP-binding protein [Clostridiales bacterium]|nr:ABC transporter ATP-binding protein [Clostridiales bacterium]